MSTGDLRRWTWWTGWTEWTHVTQHKGLMAMNSCCKMHHLQRGVLPPVFTPEECLWGKNRSEITMQNTVYPITSRVPPNPPPPDPRSLVALRHTSRSRLDLSQMWFINETRRS